MLLELRDKGPKITEADIMAFEERIGQPFPRDYRVFLFAYNGGRPENHVIRNVETGDIGVKIFFGIHHKEYFDINAENQSMRGRWPTRFLSIAIGDCGDRFCLSLGPPDYGSVYFWNHEQESEDDEEPTELNLYYLAESFTEFWKRIELIDRDEYLAEKGFDLDTNGEPRSESPQPPSGNGESH